MAPDKLEDVYNITPCYFFSFSESEIITRMNQTMLDQLGFDATEVIGVKKFSELLTVGSRIFYQTHFFPLIKMHRKFNEIFLSFLCKNKEEIPVLLNVKLAGSNDVYEIHCGGMKIVQRNRFEKELLEAKRIAEKALLENEALSNLRHELEKNQEILEKRLRKITQKSNEQKQINNVISHDLQEPLRKISVFSNLLLDDIGNSINEKAGSYLKKINLASEKMRQLVLSIQKFLSLDEKHFLAERIPLNDVFKDAVERIVSHNSPFKVRFDLDPLPQIIADYHLMVSLFYELLSNSIKFRDDAKKELLISLKVDSVEQNIYQELEDRYKYENFTRLRYSDNGLGFNKAFEEEVFVLFRKAHNNDSGLGFGLTYCKKIIDLHHGSISVKSQKGKGSEFTILLPALTD